MSRADELRAQIRGCRDCSLFKVGRGPVPFSGPAPNLLAVVGEAPGQTEDERGEPFVGRAGTLLRECMTAAGIDPGLATFINTVSCFPNRTPNAGEVSACSSNLLAQLQFTNPLWVVLLGNVALNAWRPDLKVSRARGKVLTPPSERWRMFVTFHPSFALRQAKGEKIMRSDLMLLAEMMDADDFPLEGSFDGDGQQNMLPGYDTLTDDSCASCGATPDELGDHDEAIYFDRWNVPYCATCWPKAPQNAAEQKEQAKVGRRQAKTGQLFG